VAPDNGDHEERILRDFTSPERSENLVNEGKFKAGQPAVSWMVRCWEEPREKGSDPPVYRCFVRDLKTGEERYLNDPCQLGELLNREMRGAEMAAEESQETPGTGS